MSDFSSPSSTPGSKALSLMRKDDDLQVFKKPRAPVSCQVRKKQKVLEEDIYIEVSYLRALLVLIWIRFRCLRTVKKPFIYIYNLF